MVDRQQDEDLPVAPDRLARAVQLARDPARRPSRLGPEQAELGRPRHVADEAEAGRNRVTVRDERQTALVQHPEVADEWLQTSGVAGGDDLVPVVA